MRTLSALYDSTDHAALAVSVLKAAGVPSADISLVSNTAATPPPLADEIGAGNGETAGEGATAGAGVGAIAGGGAGLLAGLGTLAIPGIGPVIAGGWLLATAVGAIAGAAVGGAAGGLLGALASAGVPEDEAHAFAEGIRRGGTLVSVRVAEQQADTIDTLLRGQSGVDIGARRNGYLAEGWTGFDERGPACTEEQIRQYRSSKGTVPPIG